MNGEKENMEQKGIKTSQTEAPKKKPGFIKELFGGSMITEKLILPNLAFLLFLTLIGAIYIGNRFQAEKTIREINNLTEEVTDLRARALFISADLMEASRQSEVYRLVKERGLTLEELKEPPYKIVKNSR